ncbi:MAG: hypothetical protein WC342_05225 [Methanoregula sp.]|jgi:hypothetical protein
MDKKTKEILSILVFIVITMYSLLSNYWIMWAVITLMLFIESIVDSVKEWFDTRQEIYIAAKKSMHPPTSTDIEKITSIEQSISQIEKRLDVLENNSRSVR